MVAYLCICPVYIMRMICWTLSWTVSYAGTDCTGFEAYAVILIVQFYLFPWARYSILASTYLWWVSRMNSAGLCTPRQCTCQVQTFVRSVPTWSSNQFEPWITGHKCSERKCLLRNTWHNDIFSPAHEPANISVLQLSTHALMSWKYRCVCNINDGLQIGAGWV